MGAKDIPVWEKYTLTIEEAARYFRIGEGKLRHTFCTEMAKAGMNPKALQYIMGHKDIKMTLGYYAHMDGCTAAEEMRRVAV